MSDREWAFGQLLASLGPQTEVDTETLQCVFNAGWDASSVVADAQAEPVPLSPVAMRAALEMGAGWW
jgi:hypothetical protein